MSASTWRADRHGGRSAAGRHVVGKLGGGAVVLVAWLGGALPRSDGPGRVELHLQEQRSRASVPRAFVCLLLGRVHLGREVLGRDGPLLVPGLKAGLMEPHRQARGRQVHLVLDVGGGDRPAAPATPLARALAAPDLLRLRVRQLARRELGADEGASVWFFCVVHGGTD